MEKVNVGEIYLSKELIEKVEAHRKMIAEANPEQAEAIEKASFGIIFSDWLVKNVG